VDGKDGTTESCNNIDKPWSVLLRTNPAAKEARISATYPPGDEEGNNNSDRKLRIRTKQTMSFCASVQKFPKFFGFIKKGAVIRQLEACMKPISVARSLLNQLTCLKAEIRALHEWKRLLLFVWQQPFAALIRQSSLPALLLCVASIVHKSFVLSRVWVCQYFPSSTRFSERHSVLQ
jgi:hypothetical protein